MFCSVFGKLLGLGSLLSVEQHGQRWRGLLVCSLELTPASLTEVIISAGEGWLCEVTTLSLL